MAHDESAAGLLDHATDTHLADRARSGEVIAFDLLLDRHLQEAVRYATILTASPEEGLRIGARSFTDVFEQIDAGGWSLDDPFLPGLLRSVRELTPAGPLEDVEPLPIGTHPPAAVDAFWTLAADERAIRHLAGTVELDDRDIALAFGVSEEEIAAVDTGAAASLGAHAGPVTEMLLDLDCGVDDSTVDAAREHWRTWLLGRDLSPVVPVSAFTRIQPFAVRALQGAAALLLVAGGAGLLLGGGDRDAGEPSAAGATTVTASGDVTSAVGMADEASAGASDDDTGAAAAAGDDASSREAGPDGASAPGGGATVTAPARGADALERAGAGGSAGGPTDPAPRSSGGSGDAPAASGSSGDGSTAATPTPGGSGGSSTPPTTVPSTPPTTRPVAPPTTAAPSTPPAPPVTSPPAPAPKTNPVGDLVEGVGDVVEGVVDGVGDIVGGVVGGLLGIGRR